MTRHQLFGQSLSVRTFRASRLLIVPALVVATVGCTREPASETTRQETEAPAADTRQEEHSEEVAQLNERVAEIERKYTEANREVTSGARTATAGLREELKEDVANVKEAVSDLGTTTPENWWERHEQAMARTADDIEADVRRIAGTGARTEAGPTGTTGAPDTGNAANAPFTSRRDAFIASLRERVESMEKRLESVKASGARETELTDTRARIDKLEEDIDKVRSASADDWWDISKARVTGYVERVEDSVGRLDDDKPVRE